MARRTTRNLLRYQLEMCAKDCVKIKKRVEHVCVTYLQSGHEEYATMLYPFIPALEEMELAFIAARKQM